MPEVEESKKSLRFAILQTLGTSILILICIVLFSNFWVRATINNEKQKNESNLIQIMTLVRNSIEPDLMDLRTGKNSREKTLQNVESKLRHMTYMDIYGENYVFLINYDGYILVQPYQPWLENTNQWSMQDSNGVYLIQGLLDAARSEEKGGFFSYNYNPPNLHDPEEKLSYVIDVPELDCIIGTGMYMRLYYEGETAAIRQITLLTCLLACLVLITTLISLRRISLTAKKLEVEIIKRNEVQQKLVDSEMNLRTIFNSMSDAIFIQTEKGVILEVNDRVMDMFGCKRDDVIGNTVKNISASSEYSEEKLLNILNNAIKSESSIFEYRAKRLDNQEEFYVEVALRPIRWYGQNLSLAVVRNIQNRKYIERELIKNQTISEQSEEIGNYGNFSIDLVTKTYKWSKGIYKIFQRDENLPAPDFDEYHRYFHPEDLERLIQNEKSPRIFNKVKKIECRIIRGDNEVRDIQIYTTWLQNENPYIVGSIRDITEQRLAISQLIEREEKFRTTVQQMTDGLVVIDEKGSVIEWNSAEEKISGIPAEKVIGRPIWEVLPFMGIDHFYSGHLGEMQSEIIKSAESGESVFFHQPSELVIQTASGQYRTMLQTVFPIKISNKFMIGVISHDITEQKAALDKINHELRKLASLRSIDATILERTTADKTLQMISAIAVDLLNMDGAIILAKISKTDIAQAFNSRIDSPDEPLIAQLLDLQLAAIEKFKSTRFTSEDLEVVNQIHQIDAVSGKTLHQTMLPLIMNKKVSGYIQVFSRNPIPDDQEWMDYFLTLAGQTSLAIENVTLITNEELAYTELNQAYEATIAGWSKALELRDEETKGHSDRVMYLACRLAKKAGISRDKMTAFRRGVLLHDIGKMGIPDRILLKPGPLTGEEWKIMRLHPGMANDLLSTIPYLHDSLEVPYSHHEHWDGSGYPRGLKGKDIPLSARIFSVVDVWDALISDRPYRKGWDQETIKAYLIDNKAVLFDPELVDLFLELMDKKDTGTNYDEDDLDCWL